MQHSRKVATVASGLSSVLCSHVVDTPLAQDLWFKTDMSSSADESPVCPRAQTSDARLVEMRLKAREQAQKRRACRVRKIDSDDILATDLAHPANRG